MLTHWLALGIIGKASGDPVPVDELLFAFPEASLTGGQIVGVNLAGGNLLTGWPTGGVIKRLQ